MRIIRMILAICAMTVCHSVTLAQPGIYESPAQWPSLLCQPTAPMQYAPMQYAPMHYAPSGGAGAAYQPNHGPTTAMPSYGGMGCSSVQHPIAQGCLTWPPQSAACAGPTISQGGCGSLPDDQRLFSTATTGGFFGGLELLWIRPNFDQNVAMIVDPPVGNTSRSFDYSANLSPRAYLGWQSCGGLGFRTTYFRFDDEAPTESVLAMAGATPVYVNVYGAGGNLSRNATANVGQTLVSDHALSLQTLDFEGTYLFRCRTLYGVCGMGARVVDIDQNLIANVFNPDGSLEESVGNRLQLTGAGPTVSALISHRLGQLPVGGYVSGRSSLLVAQSEQRIYEMQGAFTTEMEDVADHRKILGNFELGVGLQLEHCLGGQFGAIYGRSPILFARVGYEAQLWLNAGGPVDSDGAIGLDGVVFAIGLNR